MSEIYILGCAARLRFSPVWVQDTLSLATLVLSISAASFESTSQITASGTPATFGATLPLRILRAKEPSSLPLRRVRWWRCRGDARGDADGYGEIWRTLRWIRVGKVHEVIASRMGIPSRPAILHL